MMVLTMVWAISSGTAWTIHERNAYEEKAWLGTSYAASKKGYSNAAIAGIGAMGAIDGALQGAAFGAAFGGPAGVIMGAVIGL